MGCSKLPGGSKDINEEFEDVSMIPIAKHSLWITAMYQIDAVSTFVLATEKETAVGKNFNIAGGNPISIKELVELMVRILGLEGNTEIYYTGKSWKGDIVKLVADISKIKKLGFEPRAGLEEGILKLKDWFQDRYNSGGAKWL